MKKRLLFSLLFAALTMAVQVQAGELTINLAFKGANQRAFWDATIAQFEKANPDIKVRASFIEEEAYKVQLPGWLISQAPDIIKWHEGERMRYYAQRGLLEDVSADWQRNGWNTSFASLEDPSSFAGKQYALPTDYFSWGLFYRKDLFEKAGIKSDPKTWDEFLDDCKKLKAAGFTPIAVGGRDSWTLAAWFDYIDLRLNGYAFHMQLMDGKIPYTDDRVKKVYAAWKSLIDNRYFVDNALSYTLDSAQPLLIQGQAAMMLMGTFISAGLPSAVKSKMGYFQFPVIDPKQPIAEDGSADCLNIPARAKNKADARRFLAFMAKPEIDGALAKAFGSLPANNQAAVPDDPFAKKGFEILSNTKGGIAQFYDRDMNKEMADEGMKGMQRFVNDPSTLSEVLAHLEATRARIYKQ
ncbi:extracellular solute-binding protein [Burkholderia gladioli pv. gladioli]|uniref:Bacterial extracellular solute-binding family protein n=1 Tax=Burkholderia gladioli TaxID=28095 RepID=A0A095HBD6_BURGA|nr:extracellular solute-binding protein [Burkholderia gladioli]AJW98429.1 bacterial extracellular solute-binding family protein [Burkholderia gladioli]ASD79950.1 sugar ABC transporter substrate-binding protein [Burkholderia gladioli pv. gladioli]AWY54802.1 sugar ABC transporter substrate-binding protein [Burkholderia gladioli pv. gladioli]KGC10929.1 bacterial extracellular solute-binding family protein [Burkholderia gladioli]MDJ1164201.1 extracellular solute-binding protein [Burkholderia gladi